MEQPGSDYEDGQPRTWVLVDVARSTNLVHSLSRTNHVVYTVELTEGVKPPYDGFYWDYAAFTRLNPLHCTAYVNFIHQHSGIMYFKGYYPVAMIHNIIYTEAQNTQFIFSLSQNHFPSPSFFYREASDIPIIGEIGSLVWYHPCKLGFEWASTDTTAPVERQNYEIWLPPPPSPNTPNTCLLYTSPSPRDRQKSRMPSSA